MQEGDTPASIAEECGITPAQLRMLNTLDPVEENAHRTLHTKGDQEEMMQWDAKKVAIMFFSHSIACIVLASGEH